MTIKEEYDQRVERAGKAIHEADYLLIGAGAGLSSAAGLEYIGKRFEDNFQPFILKYKFRDLYSSSFYPFKTEEERWAYWAKHISLNRYETPATQLYMELLKLTKGKEYFIITTNVEHQFHKAGFPAPQIFAVQGDYGYLQCEKACHKKLYYNEGIVAEMIGQTNDCKIPSALVPWCPVCGGKMDVNLRKDNFFVEDNEWNAANKQYNAFIQKTTGEKIVFLELGVGFNTPGIIRYPFEQMTWQNSNAVLIRINKNHPTGPVENENKTISFTEDMANAVKGLLE